MSRLPGRRILSVGLMLSAAAVAVVLGAGLRGGTASAGYALLDKPAPDLAGQTLDGGHVDLRSMRGSVVVVNIWASWCAPCRHELPLIARTSAARAGQGVRVVTINTRDGTSTAREFLRKEHATGLTTISDPRGRLAVAWGATGIPETYIVDRTGIVRARWTGPVSRQWLTGEISRWTGA